MVCESAVKGMLENQTKHADDDGRGMREEGKSGRTEDEIMCGEKKRWRDGDETKYGRSNRNKNWIERRAYTLFLL